MSLSRRGFAALGLASALASSVLIPAIPAHAHDATAIGIDWAYWNPVSLILKDKGWLEEALAPLGVEEVTWVQSAGSNKAIEFLNSDSIQFGSSAGAAALLAKINGSPIRSIYVFSKPEWTALVTRPGTGIDTVEDLKGHTVAATRGTDPYIFLLRALADHGLSESDIEVVLLQHADGRNALIGEQVDAWAGLDPMMAEAELEQGVKLFYRNADLNTWGVLSVREDFAADHPEVVETVLEVYEQARQYAIENPDELRATLATAAGLTEEVAARQLERTDLTQPAIGDRQRETLLAAGLALQSSGVVEASVDVEAAVDSLIDPSFAASIAATQ